MTGSEQAKRINRLRVLGNLLLDARLSELRVAAAARTASLDRLADLDCAAIATELPDIAAAEVGLRYQRWADQRRAEINMVLARQTATWMDARHEAMLAFGKTQALDGLSRKLK